MPKFDYSEENFRGMLSGLDAEQIEEITRYCKALKYDQDHPGANMAQKWRDEMEQYYAVKGGTAA